MPVYVESPLVEKFPVDSLVLEYGTSFSIPCVVSGAPAPLVIWYKNGHPLENSRAGVLEIVSFSVDDEGYYSCVGENIGGKDNVTLSIRGKRGG